MVPCLGNPPMKARVAFLLAFAPLSAGCRQRQKFNTNKRRILVDWYCILLTNISVLSFQSTRLEIIFNEILVSISSI